MHIFSALFFPLLPFLFQIAVFAYFATVAIYLAGWGVPNCRRFDVPANESQSDTNGTSLNGSHCDCRDLGKPYEPNCIFVNYTHTNIVPWLHVGNLFVMFWTIFFIDALGQITLAGAFASYYWAFRKPEDIPTFPVLRGFWRAIRYLMTVLISNFGAINKGL